MSWNTLYTDCSNSCGASNVKMMGLYLIKNYLLRYWDYLSLLNLIEALALTLLLKLLPKISEPLFCECSSWFVRPRFIFEMYSWVPNKQGGGRGGLNNRLGWKFSGYLISGGVLMRGWKIEKLFIYLYMYWSHVFHILFSCLYNLLQYLYWDRQFQYRWVKKYLE